MRRAPAKILPGSLIAAPGRPVPSLGHHTAPLQPLTPFFVQIWLQRFRLLTCSSVSHLQLVKLAQQRDKLLEEAVHAVAPENDVTGFLRVADDLLSKRLQSSNG